MGKQTYFGVLKSATSWAVSSAFEDIDSDEHARSLDGWALGAKTWKLPGKSGGALVASEAGYENNADHQVSESQDFAYHGPCDEFWWSMMKRIFV
jgi:hypothetical protein